MARTKKTAKEPKKSPELPEDVANAKGEDQMPSETPPAAGSGVSTEHPLTTIAGIGDAAPSIQVTAEEAGVAAWLNNKQIIALWSINQNRNSWVNISGVGWKKLSTSSDSAIVALSMLSAHAREKGSPVNYREESDGMIHEIYVY